jgi:hypothetical protein
MYNGMLFRCIEDTQRNSIPLYGGIQKTEIGIQKTLNWDTILIFIGEVPYTFVL